MANDHSPYLSLTTEVLTALSKVRREAGFWSDSESEELARETQVFKIGECLRPFYMAIRYYPDLSLPLSIDILRKDTQFFTKTIDRHGFFPSPYSPISGAKDQYTDFAAFTLEFSALVYDFWKLQSKNNKVLVDNASSLAERALSFLLDPQHRVQDDLGTRWGGTSEYSRVKKTHEVYTDTFFTATVLLSVFRTIDHPVLNLSATRKEEIRGLIQAGCSWLVSRFDGQFLTGNEEKTNRSLVHTTWALHALAEMYDLLDLKLRKIVPTIVEAYLTALRSRFTKKDSVLQQEYLTVLSVEVDPPLYYEDRSGLGGVLLTLAELRSVGDLERLLEEASYSHVFDVVLDSVINLRNPTTGLWYGQGLILSVHSYLVEAFLVLSRRSTEFGRRLEVSSPMVREAVRAALTDEAILATIQRAVYQHLANRVDLREQGEVIREQLGERGEKGIIRKKSSKK
jgi:hypothetical protein